MTKDKDRVTTEDPRIVEKEQAGDGEDNTFKSITVLADGRQITISRGDVWIDEMGLVVGTVKEVWYEPEETLSSGMAHGGMHWVAYEQDDAAETHQTGGNPPSIPLGEATEQIVNRGMTSRV